MRGGGGGICNVLHYWTWVGDRWARQPCLTKVPEWDVLCSPSTQCMWTDWLRSRNENPINSNWKTLKVFIFKSSSFLCLSCAVWEVYFWRAWGECKGVTCLASAICYVCIRCSSPCVLVVEGLSNALVLLCHVCWSSKGMHLLTVRLGFPGIILFLLCLLLSPEDAHVLDTIQILYETNCLSPWHHCGKDM